MDFKVIGIQEVKYVCNEIDGHNCDFEYKKVNSVRHNIIVERVDTPHRSRYEIALKVIQHECPSGWQIAYTANIDITPIKNETHYPLTHIAKDSDLTINLPIIYKDGKLSFTKNEIANIVFDYSQTGDDEWYPCGSYRIDFNLFGQTPRHKEKRVVWIWVGDSGVGKSYLSSKLVGMNVYETDSSSTLPEVIYDDIIVIGNKYKFEVDEVKAKVFKPAEMIVCSFD